MSSHAGDDFVARTGAPIFKAYTDELVGIYSFQYLRQGDRFIVRAVGDLDCDGVESTFEIQGSASSLRPYGEGRPRITWRNAGE